MGPATGAASVVAHALVSDEFKVLRSSMYQLSWSFDLQGVILKESECAVAFSSVEASLTVDVTLFGPDGIVWDSGQIMAYDDSVECTGFVIVPQTVQEVHPLIGEVTTPQIGLHPLGECAGCVYSWQAQATLFVRGHATGAGAARYELWFKPRTLQTQYYDKWAKLTQLRVDDIYPDTVPPTTTCLPSGIEANGWYSSGVSVTCSVADNPSGNAPTGTPYAYGVNQTYYKIDDQQDWIAYASPFTIDSEGKHTFYFYSIDYADNREDKQTRNVWIDTTPPTGTALHINSNAQYTTSTAVSLTATASDPGGDSGSGVWQ